MENQTPETSAQEVPFKSSKSPVIAILAIFVILSLSAVAFLWYQNQQLKKMLASYQTPPPSPTSTATADPISDWETYSGSNFEYKYPGGLYLVDRKNDNISLFLNKDVAIQSDECIKNNSGTLQKPCEEPLIWIDIEKNSDAQQIPKINTKNDGTVKYVEQMTKSGSRMIVTQELIGGLGNSVRIEAYLAVSDGYYKISIVTTSNGYWETVHPNVDKSNDEISTYEKGMLDQILSTFKFLDNTAKLTTISGNQCLELLSNSNIINLPTVGSGSVSGNVYYPSEGLPGDIKVCAFDVIEKVRYCSPNIVNSNPKYQLQLPAGKYYIYALSNNNFIGVGTPNIANDYQPILNSNGEEIGRDPLLIDIVKGSSIQNIGVGDDILTENELHCQEVK